MTVYLQDLEDRLQRRWTREEIRKIEARMRARRRDWWWKRHRSGVLTIALGALAAATLSMGILWLTT
jgi:hypothetical protein